MTFDLLTFAASLVLALVAGGVGGALVNGVFVRHSERLADMRSLRDQRAERYRSIFRDLLEATTAQLDYLRALVGLTSDARMAVAVKSLREAQEGVNQAMAALWTEPEGETIRTLFNETVNAIRACRLELEMQERAAAQRIVRDTQDFNGLLTAAESANETMRAAMVEVLRQLERPLPQRALR